jgi:hypothetical protein
MSMLDVARCLYFSKSIDLSHQEERYFNLSMANSGHLFHCLNANRTHRDWSLACERESTARECHSMFGKGK